MANKINSSISTVPKWNNVKNDKISIYLDVNTGFISSTRIYKNNKGNYIFKLYVNTYVPKYSLCSVDILIGNKQEVIDCVSNYSYLLCEIESDKFSNEEIYLSKVKSNSSSITWNNLNENIILSAIHLEFIYAYLHKQYDKNNNEYNSINILINEDKLKFNYFYRLGILLSEKEDYLNCELINYRLLTCKIDHLKDEEKKELYIIGGGTDGIIDWISPNKYTYDKNELYILKYKNILICFYDDINNFFNFTIEIEYNDNQYNIDQFMLDLLVNNNNYTYGFCKKSDNYNKKFNCYSPNIDKNSNNEIKIKNNIQKYGNTKIQNIPNDELTIYPNNLIYIKPSKIYGLKFSFNKWEFYIESLNKVQFDGSKKLYILKDGIQVYADCIKDNTAIKCVVNSASQQNNQLIKLRTYYINFDSIYLVSDFDFIPLLVEFEFINSSGLKYNNNCWSFSLRIKNGDDTFIIPSGSAFSIDIKLDNNLDDLAYCTERNRNGNELTLNCFAQVKNSSLITFSNSEKTKYSSVTWKYPLSEINIIIYYSVSLNVTQVYMNEFQEENSFYMVITDVDIPLGGHVKLDLIYNDKYIIAVCTLREKNKFECFPHITPQNPNDKIIISYKSYNGTVTFINSPDKLNFVDTLNFVKVYNLKFIELKWKFNIELYESKIKNGKNIEIDVLVDDEKSIANCAYNNNILNCIVGKEDQDQFSIIKLINDYNNNIIWNNLQKITTLYHTDDIIFKDINGGFIDGKWKFNIYYEPVNKIKKMYNIYGLLDISVNNKESTAICLITYSSFLKCVANYENQNINDKIVIDINKDKILGTINFQKIQTESKKSINYSSFYLKYEKNYGYRNQNNNLEILIEGSLYENIIYDLEEDSVTIIELVKYKNNNEKINYNVTCLTNNIKKEKGSYIYMICTTELPFDNNKIEIKIDSDGYSKNIRFTQKTNIEISYQN